MKNKQYLSLLFLSGLLLVQCAPNSSNKGEESKSNLVLNLTFDDHQGTYTKETVSNLDYKVNYVFNEDNANNIFKEVSNPIYRDGVKGDALYMDGFSTYIKIDDFYVPGTRKNSVITMSAWVAPRGFENLFNYGDDTPGKGHSRLTPIFSKGDIEMGEGFIFGYGRLGMWGIQLCLHSNETDEDFMVGFYDPINTLQLYEWNHVAVTFDGKTGYIALFYNGKAVYEEYVEDLIDCKVVSSEDPLYMGAYTNPLIEMGCKRQFPAGLIDEAKIYNNVLTPDEIYEEYSSYFVDGKHPSLDYNNVAEDRAQYEGDRYRPIYHGIPSAVWMNEPHSPFYYKGRYHLMYQHNPIGPYWSQIRWGHLVSDDMIHWKTVKDSVAPTKDICPEGVWTGGVIIGPDDTPWLVITAGTNTSTWSGQNIAFAHAVDPSDPDLTEWVIEPTCVLTQPAGDIQGERDQFRDPFLWEDDGVYYMLISTSIPGKGGSANIYTSTDLRDWEYKGYLVDIDFNEYPEQGAHFECVNLLPISNESKTIKKYILFDCPQYTTDGYIVDCLYWIGTFDKNTCRFIPDDPKPQYFDLGRGIYTGQTGLTYLTDEDRTNGKTNYTDGRTILFALSQGKAAGTEHNLNSGWAHNLAMPVELSLADDGKTVIRKPIEEIESAYGDTLFDYVDSPISAASMNEKIKDIRGDSLRIDFEMDINPTSTTYNGGLYVRYNKNEVNSQTEKTGLVFSNNGFYVDRTQSTLKQGVEVTDSYTYNTSGQTHFNVTVLLDHSSLEVYINDVITFTTRIYPKYGDSDYLHFFDNNIGLTISNFKVVAMNSVYFDTTTPSYFGNVGNLGGND